MTATLNPESRTPSPRLTLPPSPRDFEIHRLSSIELLSTRKIAGQFKISQTRVRQIVEEVSRWLAEKLPFVTDLDLEREKRFALHLAAAQLRHQIEQLQELWTDSKDTKYLRQQNRCILALARLGIIPGALDALAADAECEIGLRSASAVSSLSPDSCPLTPSSSSPPPFEDCSPKLAPHSITPTIPQPAAAPTPLQSTPSSESFIPEDADLDDLNVIEKHLLTVLDQTPLDKSKNRDALNQALAEVRQKRACCSLEISPNVPGVTILPGNSPTLDQVPATQNA